MRGLTETESLVVRTLIACASGAVVDRSPSPAEEEAAEVLLRDRRVREGPCHCVAPGCSGVCLWPTAEGRLALRIHDLITAGLVALCFLLVCACSDRPAQVWAPTLSPDASAPAVTTGAVRVVASVIVVRRDGGK